MFLFGRKKKESKKQENSVQPWDRFIITQKGIEAQQSHLKSNSPGAMILTAMVTADGGMNTEDIVRRTKLPMIQVANILTVLEQRELIQNSSGDGTGEVDDYQEYD